LSSLAAPRFGIEKAAGEPSRMRRNAYRFIGEIHIPGRIRLNHVFREIKALGLPEHKVRLLDAGTGRGDIALHLARLHPDWLVHGIDLEDDRVERCRTAAKNLALSNASFSRDNLLNLSANSQYDLITNTDVLEHIEDDRGALANLARALAPGGYLLLTFPSVPQRRHLKLVAWRERRIGFKPEDIGHVRPGYSPEMINGLAREVGLEPVKTVWTYGPFGNLAHDLFFVLGDSKPNPIVFATSLPFLLTLSFLENHTTTRHGSGLLAIVRKPTKQ
jgi:SAM-dependent methyltransferase